MSMQVSTQLMFIWKTAYLGLFLRLLKGFLIMNKWHLTTSIIFMFFLVTRLFTGPVAEFFALMVIFFIPVYYTFLIRQQKVISKRLSARSVHRV